MWSAPSVGRPCLLCCDYMLHRDGICKASVVLYRHPEQRAMTSNGRLLGKMMMRRRSGRRRSEKLVARRQMSGELECALRCRGADASRTFHRHTSLDLPRILLNTMLILGPDDQ